MKKKNYLLSMLIFFLVMESAAFLFLNFVLYPAVGISYSELMQGVARIIIIQHAVVFVAAIIFFFIGNPLRKVIAKINNNIAIDPDEVSRIHLIEKRLKTFVVWVNVLGFILAPIASTTAISLSMGLMTKASLRYIIVNIATGPALAIILNIYLSYVFRDIKVKANIRETKMDSKKIDISKKLVLTVGALSFLFMGALTFMAVAQAQNTVGINNYGIRITDKFEEYDNNRGYFSDLIEKSLASSDPAVRSEAEALVADWETESTKRTVYIILIGWISLFVYFVLLFVVARELNSHIRSIRSGLRNINSIDGDMTQLIVKTENSDFGEIQVLINQLIINLNKTFLQFANIASGLIERNQNEQKTMDELVLSAKQMNESVELMENEIGSQNQTLEETTRQIKSIVDLIRKSISASEEQSQLIHETELSFKRMDESIRSVSDSTKKASGLGEQLVAASEGGRSVLGEMKGSIDSIVETGSGISEIVSTIYSIADEINMLAMNAAIEAAHAGEAGKGFAIVADEIRSLAENTSRQTNDISDLLHGMQKTIEATEIKSQNMTGAMDKIKSDVDSTISLIKGIDQESNDQMALSTQNSQVVQNLVAINENVMQTLGEQQGITDGLLHAVENLNESSMNTNQAMSTQKSFFAELNSHIERFKSFLLFVNSQLQQLDEKLAKLKLLPEEFLDENS